MGKKQLICSSCFTVKTYQEKSKLLGSSVKDYVKDGEIDLKSATSGDGVLLSWKNVPLGLWDVPTLNGMVYSRALWEAIIANPLISCQVENNAAWGEAWHADRDEVIIPEVACRHHGYNIADNNLVVGDLDIMNTPNGLIAYTLAMSGRIGSSTRGYGELVPIPGKPGLTDVNIKEYVHVCQDLVCLPAVPEATYSTEATENLTHSIDDALTQGLREMVSAGLERNPNNRMLFEINNILNGGKYQEDVYKARIAASLKRLKR